MSSREIHEVVRDALRALQERQREHDLKLKRLRKAIQAGIDAVDRGGYVDLAEDELGPYIARLGEEAAKEVKRAKKRKG
jgi:Arc/MetJ-type ribon-helix-helix transcriptional regulator